MNVKPVKWIKSIMALMILFALSAGGVQAIGDRVRAESHSSIEIGKLATTGTTARVSVNSSREQGNGQSLRPSISGNGRYVAFWSEANNLVSGDTNDTRDIFLHDNTTGQTKRVSVASDGSQGNNGSGSYITAISSDGRYVTFESYASNIVLDDTNNRGDIFVHDQLTGQTILVSIATDGTRGNADSYWPAISANGQYVAFSSSASNLISGDTNGKSDIFIHDMLNGETERVSVASDGTQADNTSWLPTISDDGRYVAFASWATNFVPVDSIMSNIFVHDRDLGQTMLVSVSSDGTQANSWSDRPSISGDGSLIAFSSDASNLVSGDSNAHKDVFVHDQNSGLTSRISVATDGTQGNADSATSAISSDGRYVTFFSRANNLVSGDSNSVADIFFHDRQTAQTELISLSSEHIQGDNGGWVPAISSDGRYVAFDSSSSNLVCGDTNNEQDIFVRDRSGELVLSSISGRVTHMDDTPIADVTITDSEGNMTTTDSGGNYQLDQLVPCKYSVTPSKDRYIFSPLSKEIIVPPSTTNTDFIGEPLYTISGKVRDSNNQPLQGINVSDGAGHTDITDSQGEYYFVDLPAGTYTIIPSDDTYIFSPTSRQVTLPPDGLNQDFIGELLIVYLPAVTRNYCNLSYRDDFSDPQSGWPIYEDGDVLYEYLNGEYRILVKNWDSWAAASPDYQTADYIVAVDVRKAGDVWGKYGIIFGLAEDWSHFYIFEIDPDGGFNIWRFSSSSGWKLLKWDHSPYINQSSASNELKVKRSSSLIEVYANDHLLAALTDNTYTGLGYLGLIVDAWNFGNVDARFDNFYVTPSECVGTTALSSSESQGRSSTNPQIMFQEEHRKLR